MSLGYIHCHPCVFIIPDYTHSPPSKKLRISSKEITSDDSSKDNTSNVDENGNYSM